MHSQQFADEEHVHYDEVDHVDHEELQQEVSPTPPQLSRSTSSTTSVTRTVAIIKPHALAHRFDIERRIQEASFEIVKERQMEFDTETDPDTLYELFGEDADAFAEGPVWVYVLERRRAVEVWNTLMGDRDVDVARQETPNSLRALYGRSLQQNGVMGSPDNHTAEIQIASLFASSPPFPTTDLPSDGDTNKFGSIRSVASSVLESIRKAAATAGEDEGYAPSSVTNPSTVGGGSGGKLNANGKAQFKARPIPTTTAKPDIVPRTTKAAALRAGQLIEKTQNTPRAPVSKERHAATFANVPGHKRASTIAVASTAAPTIAPRMTKAASLRLGQTPTVAPPIRRRALTNEEKGKANGEMTKHGPAATFEGVPGHKRRESIAVASVKAPSVAPRLNKSAALRAQKDQGPPTSFMFKAPTQTKTPTLSRTSSANSLSPPRLAARPASQASISVTPSAPRTHGRASSVFGTKPPGQPLNGIAKKPTITRSASSSTPVNGASTNGNGIGSANGASPTTPRPASVASKLKPRPSTASAPSIAPRTNRSAALRAAKQEAENAAAAAAAAKKRPGPRPSKVAPSSFKAVPV